MKTKLLPLLLALALAGCVSTPAEPAVPVRPPLPHLTDAEAKAATYPPKPDYKRVITNYLGLRLKDPDSAKYDGWILARAYLPGSVHPIFGYMVTVRYNAKNSYGGYVGYKMEMFWIDGDMIKPLSDLSLLGVTPQLVDIVETG